MGEHASQYSVVPVHLDHQDARGERAQLGTQALTGPLPPWGPTSLSPLFTDIQSSQTHRAVHRLTNVPCPHLPLGFAPHCFCWAQDTLAPFTRSLKTEHSTLLFREAFLDCLPHPSWLKTLYSQSWGNYFVLLSSRLSGGST